MPQSALNLDLFDWSQRRALRDAPSSRSSRSHDLDAIGPRGLLVRDPYATQILNGEKLWEIRGRSTQIRGTIVIIKSTTGRAFGTVDLVNVLGPLSLDDLIYAEQLPEEEREEFRRDGLPYKKTYAYVLGKPRWFSHPVSYHHPSGAVTWVRLPEMDLGRISFASQA